MYVYLSDSTGTLLVVEVDGSLSSSSNVVTLSPANLKIVSKSSEVDSTKNASF